MPKMAIGCHSNGSAHFEEKTLIHQIIHLTKFHENRRGSVANASIVGL